MRRKTGIKILRHDKSTAAGAILGVVAIVFLVGQQLAILFGLFTYMSVLVDHSGADIWVLTKDVDDVNSSGSLPVRYVDRIAALSEVEWVEPLILGGGLFRSREGKYQPVQMVGLPRPRLENGPWRFSEGSLEVLLDYEGATVDGLDLNVLGYPGLFEFYEVSGRRIRISAITRNIRGFAGTLIFTNMEKAREVSGLPPGRCSHIILKARPGSDITAVAASLRTLLPSATVMTSPQLSASTRRFYLLDTGIGSSFGFSVIIGALVGIVIITLTMYTSVLNHRRDYAVLQALGARKRDVLVVVFWQALMIGLIGIFVGFLLLTGFIAGTRDSRLPADMPLWFPPLHAAITLVLCLLGSTYAMRKAVKVEPASVFR
jgi:putative ABC transport system permease protein